MQLPEGVAFVIDQVGLGLERSQDQIRQLTARIAQLEQENEALRAATEEKKP